MKSKSKDLLHLEAEASSLDSKLLFCGRDGGVQSQILKPDLADKKPNISSVPKSQILTKLKDFLPVFSEDTKKLELDAKNNPDKYDIEALTGEESECIEMDLMLGVAELRTQEAVSAAESAIASYQPVINLATSDNDTESEDSSDDEDEDEDKDNIDVNSSKSQDDGAFSVGKESKPAEKKSSKKSQKRKRQPENRANIVELS